MRRTIISLLSIVIVLTLGSCAKDIVDLTGDIQGTVKDYNYGQLINNCQVTLSPSGESTTTSSGGLYKFKDLEAGDYTLTFSKAGYNEESTRVTVTAGQTTEASIMLKAKSAFALSETTLDFGDLESNKTFYVYNNSDADCSYNTSNIPSWLSLSRQQGTLPAGSSESISATVNRVSADYGDHSQVVTFNYSGKSTGSVQLLVKFQKVQLKAPTVSVASSAENVTQVSFDIKGNIDATGGSLVTSYGHCWSLSENPTISNNCSNLGSTSKTGSFTSSVSGLSTNTTYYVRAYATNAQGTSYSQQVTVTTQDVASDKWDGNIATSFAGGSGTYIDPYIIKTGGQLLLAKNYSDKYFELGGNIDLDNKNWLPYKFSGNLDGKGYFISNLRISRTDDYQGLFSECSGAVSNLTIKNVSINATTSKYIGAISGKGGTITNCSIYLGSDSKIIGTEHVGGISGINAIVTNSMVESYSSDAVIKGDSYVGGILGSIECYDQNLEMNNLHVKCGISGSNAIGGIIGYSTGRKYFVLQKSSFVGNISGNTMIGGIIGSSTNSDGYSHTDRKPDYDVLIQECMVNASIYASAEIAGGVVGTTPSYGSLYVIGCYSNGDIHAKEQVGGIIGGENYENAILCFSTMNSSSASFTGLGYNVGGKDCATTSSKLSNATCSNCCQECTDITTFMRECYSDYASCWNFNNTWTWEGEISGEQREISCPKLAWEK